MRHRTRPVPVSVPRPRRHRGSHLRGGAKKNSKVRFCFKRGAKKFSERPESRSSLRLSALPGAGRAGRLSQSRARRRAFNLSAPSRAMVLGLPREATTPRSEQTGRPVPIRSPRSPPNRNVVLRELAAEHADGHDLRLPCGGRVIGRIPYRNSVAAFDPKLLKHNFEDVRRRFRTSSASSGRSLHLD